jgi:3-deoxy-manno-octulosonate cytidylyltransferase (CMP-KDO synthetase)
MVQHVYERAKMARYLDDVVVATDDHRIVDAVGAFGGRAKMTRDDHASGTDRLAEIASADSSQVFVNIQGDEPLIDPEAIDAAIQSITFDEAIPMATLKKKIVHDSEVRNPNVVKVITNHAGDAIYFSRSPIPYERDGPSGDSPYFKHIGLYVYRRDFLLQYSDLQIGPLEKAERLEQLRALENGYSIRVVETDYESLGVDHPEDLERVNQLFTVAAGRLGYGS